MNRMTPALARLLVDERRQEASQRRRRTAPSATTATTATDPVTSTTATPVAVPRQRRGDGLLARLVQGAGVRLHPR